MGLAQHRHDWLPRAFGQRILANKPAVFAPGVPTRVPLPNKPDFLQGIPRCVMLFSQHQQVLPAILPRGSCPVTWATHKALCGRPTSPRLAASPLFSDFFTFFIFSRRQPREYRRSLAVFPSHNETPSSSCSTVTACGLGPWQLPQQETAGLSSVVRLGVRVPWQRSVMVSNIPSCQPCLMQDGSLGFNLSRHPQDSGGVGVIWASSRVASTESF